MEVLRALAVATRAEGSNQQQKKSEFLEMHAGWGECVSSRLWRTKMKLIKQTWNWDWRKFIHSCCCLFFSLITHVINNSFEYVFKNSAHWNQVSGWIQLLSSEGANASKVFWRHQLAHSQLFRLKEGLYLWAALMQDNLRSFSRGTEAKNKCNWDSSTKMC